MGAGSPWSSPEVVAGFVASAPNATLMHYAGRVRAAHDTAGRVLDLGCGAGRNAAPLADMGWYVVGTDVSWPMLEAAAARRINRLRLVLAPMHDLPIADGSVDLIIAHGIWNLARSGAEFRQAVAEAARVARKGASLFVFTFSRNTLPASAEAVAGETFVFTQFSGAPQCFLTADQLTAELGAVGFAPDPALPLRELNRPAAGVLRGPSGPVIYEGAFTFS